MTTVVALEVCVAALTLGGAAALARLLPGLPGYRLDGPSQSFVLVLVLAGLLMLFVAALGWWDLAAFTAPAKWRNTHLYWLPAVLLVVPLIAGVRLPSTATAAAILVIAYFATAVFEEGLWRGVMIGLLRPVGVWPAVVISSLLFGLGHLSNSALRGYSTLILLQALGSAVQGIGLAALRLRTNTIWLLMAFHALHDLSLQLGQLPIAAIEAPIDIVLCGYGVFLLRRQRSGASAVGSGPG